MDLEELWAIQEAQGSDDVGHDLAIVVPVDDPEGGPYTGYAFVHAGGELEPGWRMLTPAEVDQALGAHRDEPGDD